MKRFWLFVIIGIVLSISIFAAGSYSYLSEYGPAIVNWGSNVKYGGKVLFVIGLTTNAVNNNPFSSSYQLEPTGYIYEPLFYINSIDGQITNMLGTSYKWKDNNLELVVTTRNDVKWSDGVPFTANDVSFTFNLLKKYPALDLNGIWSPSNRLQSVQASGTNTVIFKFSNPNTPLFNIIGGTLILPEHIWSQIKDPVTFTNPNPIGTGPFILKTFNVSTNTITLIKNPNYWMNGRPYVDELEIRGMNSGTTLLMEMLKGTGDMASFYQPDINKLWVEKDPALNKIYWPAYCINGLYMNTQKYPFNNQTFRKAINFAINKEQLEQAAYFGIGGVANPADIIPSQQSEWLDPTLTALASELNTYDPQKAQELLSSIGFKMNSNGQLVGPDGNVLPTYEINIPNGWTDYITQADIISQNLKKIGLNANVHIESLGAYDPSNSKGYYDMTIANLVVGPNPYYFYYQFSPAVSATEIGKVSSENWARYVNPQISELLQEFSTTSNLEIQKAAIYKMGKIFLDEMPFIPLTNETYFGEYSEREFTGWPSSSIPYATTDLPMTTDGEIVLLNVHLK